LGHNVSVSRVHGGPGTFATKTEAKRAREKARERLGSVRVAAVTVRDFWERWTTDPLFARPKDSTNIHNRERMRAFVEHYGARRIDQVDDEIVGEWLAGGKHNGTVPALRAMFNDAASAKAGRLVRSNPFARLYGHRDHERALDRVTAAYGRTASFTQMQLGDAQIPSQAAGTLLQ
jgi:hypothetical protein